MAIWNERIHELRIEKGITLAQVAEKLGVTEATAQRYERGNIKSIPYEHMCSYGEILNCSPCYLMGWEEKTKETPKILQYYNQLDDIGQCVATEKIKELIESSRYTEKELATKSDKRLQQIIHYYNGMDETGKESLAEQAEYLFGKHQIFKEKEA